MALTSDFTRRARALEDSLLSLARNGSAPVDPTSSTAALARANVFERVPDADDPLPTSETPCVEHAYHRAAVTLARETRERGVALMRATTEGAPVISDEEEDYFGSSEERADAFGTSVAARLLDSALSLVESCGVSGAPLFTTIEVMMEACTLREALDLVCWCETRKSRMREERVWKRGKLTTLRTLIALMKRCAGRGMREARLKGRASVLMSWLMGVSDRSGLNLSGTPNPNVTPIFEQEAWVRDASDDGDAMDADDVQVVEDDANDVVDADDTGAFGADEAFHKTFWSLQLYFQNPPETMTKDGAWNTFCAALRVVLEKFEEHPLGETAMTVDAPVGSEIADLIGMRFLTARRLLPLQMTDYLFRRQVLIQCVFFLDHVGTEKYAEHVVDDEIKEMSDRAMELLKRTGPGAETTATLVSSLVEDEAGWRKWKEDGCPSFEKPPIDFETEPMPENYDPKYSQWPPDQYPPSDPNLKHDFGYDELNRLWNLGDTSDALKPPTLEEFFGPCIIEMDPAQDVEEQYRRVNDPVFRWRALRLISADHMHLLPKITAEGLESVIPELLGVPDPRPPKPEKENENEGEAMDERRDVLSTKIEPIEGELEQLAEEARAACAAATVNAPETTDAAPVEDAMDTGAADTDDQAPAEAEVEAEATPIEEKTPEVKTEKPVEEKERAEATPEEKLATTTTTEEKPATTTPESDKRADGPSQRRDDRRGRGGRGGRGGRSGRGGRGRDYRDREPQQQARAVRPPPRQQAPSPRDHHQPRRDQPVVRGGRQNPPPPRHQDDRSRGPPQNQRDGRERQQQPRRQQPPPPPPQSNLGKRRRSDDDGGRGGGGGPHDAPTQHGGPRARGNQGQRYNNRNNRNYNNRSRR